MVGKFSKEADITRSIGLEVCKKLDSFGVKTVFAQEKDLAKVCRTANIKKADVFIAARNILAKAKEIIAV